MTHLDELRHARHVSQSAGVGVTYWAAGRLGRPEFTVRVGARERFAGFTRGDLAIFLSNPANLLETS